MDKFNTDYVKPDLRFEFLEDSSEVDGQHVLAKVKGVFFCPDGVSRNKRFYPKQLWEKVLSDEPVQQKLKTRTMFGTIGHDTELNDKTLQEGLFSHITTKAYIDSEGRGIGEALILNTPSGRILNTLLRAGSELFVSSRADGRFKGTKNGLPVVDENTYSLKGWDFVLSPGFLEANPKIAEEYFENISKGEYKMSESLLSKLSEENGSLREKLVLKEAEVKVKIGEALEPIREENAHMKTQLHEAEASIEELKESVSSLEEERNKLSEKLEQYETLGESFENVKAALEEADSFMRTVSEKFGTVDEIEEALTLAIAMKEEWEAIGTPETVRATLEIAEALLLEKKEAEDDKKANDLADKLDVKVEGVKKLMKRGLTEEEIEDVLGAAKKDKEDKPKKDVKPTDENLGDVEEEKPVLRKSRASRLIEDLNR